MLQEEHTAAEDPTATKHDVKEHFNAAGKVVQIGDWKLRHTLGRGAYGTVRLAQRVKAEDVPEPDRTPSSRRRSVRDRRVSRSHSAPSGDDFFQMTPAELTATEHHKNPIKVATETIQSLLRSTSNISMYEEKSSDKEEQDEFVAIKIFNKSVLKRKRTIERNRETRRVLVKTALDQVEREIALMKKLSHPNLVQFHEVIDSIESDMLYMVR